jgi:hypothetical protein
MIGMHLDHLSFAVGADGLAGTTERLSGLLGESFVDGGIHPRFGTRNRVLPLTDGQYLEVVEVLDHPASDKAPFGQAVRARSEAGGGWLGWVVSVDDITPFEQRLGRESVVGNRHRPDGVELTWRQLGIKGLLSDPQLPYMVQWTIDDAIRPGADKDSELTIAGLQIAGDPQRVRDWLGTDLAEPLADVDVEWVAPRGTPGLMAVDFRTPQGVVRL